MGRNNCSNKQLKSLALDQLGVADDDAEFEVIEEPKQGLFGRTQRGSVRAPIRQKLHGPRHAGNGNQEFPTSARHFVLPMSQQPAPAAGHRFAQPVNHEYSIMCISS